MFRFKPGKVFFINLILAAALLSVLLWWLLRFLDNYTHHGELIIVPDLKGLSLDKIDLPLKDKQLSYEVVDSIYDTHARKGTVVAQDPSAGNSVKQNRTIYLTVNALLPPRIKMPNLIDLSLRQALGILEAYGLKAGELRYINDVAKNAVIAQTINDADVLPGAMVRKSSVINLVLGNGLGAEKVPVPSLIGMTKAEALDVLKANSLNTGGMVYDNSVVTSDDSVKAIVWKQYPASGKESENMISMGGYVDLWLSLLKDKAKDK